VIKILSPVIISNVLKIFFVFMSLPAPIEEIYRIGSMKPGAVLLDAFKEYKVIIPTIFINYEYIVYYLFNVV